MKQKVDIRKIGIDDIKCAAELEQEIFSDPWSPGTLTQTACNEHELLIGAWSTDGVLSGYAALSFILDEANINRIAVRKEFRRQNIGSGLLTAAEELLGDEISIYNLEVRQSNTPAINLYLSAGYQIVGERKRFYTDPCENAILMTKRKV
ncbi:MAG: ribosomal protein S18-alanine N-acetyltransferase [Oscillospiraceae bacterium]|nr:ribosomal protein S18-alanine N-acetyltransferase [Oscillospiraceae bacterium]